MPRIYAVNSDYVGLSSAVPFSKGVAALALGAVTTQFTAKSFVVDNNKHEITALDDLTLAQLKSVADYIGLAYAVNVTKATLVRAFETELSTQYMGAAIVVTSAAGTLEPGTPVFTVVSNALPLGTKDISVALIGTDNTVEKIAVKIRAAFTADADVGAAFTMSGAAGAVILTTKADAANDATLAILLADDDNTGITIGASGDTTAGVLGAYQVETIEVTAGTDKIATLQVTVTGALLGGGSNLYNVPVQIEDDTPSEVAAKIQAVIALDTDLTDHYSIAVDGAILTLTALVKAANDDTLAFTLTSADTSSVTVGASTNAVAGVLAVAQAETATISGVADVGKSAITFPGAGTFKYKVAAGAQTPLYMDDVSNWTDIVSGDEVDDSLAAQTITVAEVDATDHVLALGSAVIVVV